MTEHVLGGTRISASSPLSVAEPVADLTDVASSAADVQGVAATADLVYLGCTISEDVAGTASVTIHHGTTSAGPLLDAFKLAANEVTSHVSAPVACPNGIFVNRISGTTRLGLRTRVQS